MALCQCPLIMMIGRRLIRGCSCGLHCRCSAAAAAALSALPGCSTQGQSQALSLVTPSRLRDGVSTRGRAQPCCFWGISRCLDMQGRADSGDSGIGPAAARAGDAGPTPGSGPQGLRTGSGSAASARAGRILGPRAQGPVWFLVGCRRLPLQRRCSECLRLRLTAVRSKFESAQAQAAPSWSLLVAVPAGIRWGTNVRQRWSWSGGPCQCGHCGAVGTAWQELAGYWGRDWARGVVGTVAFHFIHLKRTLVGVAPLHD